MAESHAFPSYTLSLVREGGVRGEEKYFYREDHKVSTQTTKFFVMLRHCLTAAQFKAIHVLFFLDSLEC
jgi:hypothetical protein